MNDSRVFLDTNIFLYAALEDDFQQGKRTDAVNLLKGLNDKLVYVNTQVLNEFYSVMLRHGASDDAIRDRPDAIIGETKVSVITVKTIKRCWDIRMKYHYNYWDCLILASALEHDCDILYTEDLQNGQILEKSLKIVNPFAP
ncbi:MAG: PIN domain-containing protein [Deltaproteobacteria bacterium]|nr:PIN domain-containing protein [Deltaproteobacteria bacterium]